MLTLKSTCIQQNTAKFKLFISDVYIVNILLGDGASNMSEVPCSVTVNLDSTVAESIWTPIE